jgi:hypothetical protein
MEMGAETVMKFDILTLEDPETFTENVLRVGWLVLVFEERCSITGGAGIA